MSSADETVRVLAAQAGILAVYKPAALATEPTERGGASLVELLATKLDGSRVHAASRLDVGVSGVVLCTTTHAAARQVAAWRQAGLVERRYLGIASGPLPDAGTWDWPLGRKRDRAGRMRASPQGSRLREARTDYRVVAVTSSADPPACCLVIVRPRTGRFHQIRAHAAEAGTPLLGDRRYGGATSVVTPTGRAVPVGRIALHAATVRLADQLSAAAPVPASLRCLWQDLGGSSTAWEHAHEHLAPG